MGDIEKKIVVGFQEVNPYITSESKNPVTVYFDLYAYSVYEDKTWLEKFIDLFRGK